MDATLDNPIKAALDFMERASRLLLEALTSPGGISRGVAEGLELLDSACTYAAHPDEYVPTCPTCGSVYNRPRGMGYSCLSCDHAWIPITQP